MLIEVNNVTVAYGRKPAVWDVSFSIPEGVCVGILGPNGGGKTTLVESMLGLIKPLSGSVKFFGNSGFPTGRIAYVPQKKKIDWDFPITVFEVVLMGLYGKLGIFQKAGKKEKDRVFEVLNRIGLYDKANHHIGDLSGGQQQRMFVGRALVQDADILFLDEPFSGIDKSTEGVLVDLFKSMIENNKTIFMVHHDLNSVHQYFDWLVMMNVRLVSCGETNKIFTKDNLIKTFGRGGDIFEEAINMSVSTKKGL